MRPTGGWHRASVRPLGGQDINAHPRRLKPGWGIFTCSNSSRSNTSLSSLLPPASGPYRSPATWRRAPRTTASLPAPRLGVGVSPQECGEKGGELVGADLALGLRGSPLLLLPLLSAEPCVLNGSRSASLQPVEPSLKMTRGESHQIRH